MGKKSKKKVQWRRLSLNELPSNTSSKWQQRSTPDRDDVCHSPVSQDWDNASPHRPDQKTSYSKRGTYNLPPQNTATRGSEQPIAYGDNGHFRRAHEDDYSNYHNHMKNFGNHRNIHDKNLHLSGPNHPHFINGGGMAMPRHEYHYNRNGHPMDRIPFKNFDRDRPRFFNNGFPFPPPHLDRFHRGEPLNCPNGFPMDRRRPPFRVNGRSGNFQNFNGSPPLHRRWSNGDEGSAHCQQRFGSYHNSNGYRYRDRSNCGNGHDSGGSNGYEGGSSETQSESDERSPAQPPVQSIFIDNDQYTKIQTPRQEVIFKKNSHQSVSPSRTQESVDYQKNNLAKRSSSSSSTHSKNKKNKSESFIPSKAEAVSKKESSNSFKKLEGSRKPEVAQQKKNQSDSAKTRGKTGGPSKTKSNSKACKKSSPSSPSPATGAPQDADGARCEGKLAEGDECYPDSEDDENFGHEAEAVYAQGISDQCEGYHCTPTAIEDPTLAGVIMQQCYPGGPLVAIPVRWTASLDPTLIPGETALTPLDPAFTHLLDPSFQPLDSSKWTATPAEGDEPVPPSVVIPETVIPMQHDASGCPVTVQVKVDEHGTPLQIEPSCLAVQMSSLHHHSTCQMAGFDHGFPLQYAQRYYAEDNYRGNSFEYNFDEGLEKRLEQKIDEELAKHYSDEESDTKEAKEEDDELDDAKKASKQAKRRDSGDCEETSYDSQYASMSEGSSLPTSPAGELSDSSTACPPNTPSTSGNVSPTSPDILESSIPPLCESSANIFSGTPNASNSSVSMSSASTLCASSSSSTLVSLSSSPVNSGNPSKETSPSSPRTEFSSTETVTTATSNEKSSAARTPVNCQISSTENENGLADSIDKECVDGAQVHLNSKDDSLKVAAGIPEGTSIKEKRKISENEEARLLEQETTLGVTADDAKPENVNQQLEASMKEESPTAKFAVAADDGKTCNETSVGISEATLQLSANDIIATCNSGVSEEVPLSCVAADSIETTIHNDMTASAGTSDAVTAQHECVMVDENGVKVTVKQGYIMVPILTPYYDPSVLYGYTAAPSEAPVDQSYPSAAGSRKKKKKQNKRRAMEMSQNNYMDADLYAGEPYVTTPEGFLLPMDPTQLCQYPQPGSLYMPAVAQYSPFSVLPPGVVPHQYQPVVDEGFVSVEHTPQLPEHAPEPLCSDCVVRNDESKNNLSNQEDCSKFGPLEEIEKQQIKEILSEERHLSTAVLSVNMPESGDSDADGQHSALQDQNDVIHENPANVMMPAAAETKEVEHAKIFLESTLPSIVENTEHNEASVSLPEDLPERLEMTETDRCTELIPTETIEPFSASDLPEADPSSKNSTDSDMHSDDNIDQQEFKNSFAFEASSVSQSSPNGVRKYPSFFDSNWISSHSTTEDEVCEASVIPEICSPVSHVDNTSQSFEVNNLSNGISIGSHCREQHATITSEEEGQKDNSEKVVKCSIHIQSARIRDIDRLNTSILRCAREDALESIAEESSSCLSDSSICSEEPELITQLTAEMESALSLLHSREEKRELPVTQAVKRWIREVTPEKIFTLTAVDESCVSALSFDESTSSDDEYSEDEFLCKDDSKFNTSSTLLNSTQNNTSLDESPKNVKGNPFGSAQCSKFCTDAIAKRVADFSPALDVLEDYDGCSSVSSLSQGPLFSNPNSLVSSESSSRTITPSGSLSEVEVTVDEAETCRCHPRGYKKYYQLTMELDESPSRTTGSQSPSGLAHSQASSSDQVLPLAAEILRSQQYVSFGSGRDRNSSTTTNSLPLKSSPTPPSATSSGLGSSVATTPNSSPHHLPPHSSAPRFPFILLPPNVGAETGSASLNSIHCCSIM